MAYTPRVIEKELDELAGSLSAIAIEGAKGVGKTATASRRARTIHELDDSGNLAIAKGNPQRLLDGDPPILLDEWQHLPETWDLVRRAVDDGAPAGSFLLTGSASPDGGGRHSGAGRIASIRMRPLSLVERLQRPGTVSLAELLRGERPELSGETDVALEEYAEEIVASGFPGFRHLDGRARRTQLEGYVARIVDRDFPELGHRVRNPAGLRRWMAAYAAASSTSTSFEKIRDAATGGESEKPSRVATQPYRDILERLWVLDPVAAWQPTRNRLSRLNSAPKHQLIDPALAAVLLGASTEALLEGADLGPPIPRDGPLLGALFESLVTQSVRVYAQNAEARIGHLRTFAGDQEVDLIVERADGRVLAIEVKLARTIEDGDIGHLKWLEEKIGDELLDAVIVTTGPAAYRRGDGIGVVPAALLAS
jgi:predicted AAA+ superfamily ATPase